MSGVIFLVQGEKLVELREEPYDSEDLLQKLLADYPKILAGDQLDQENPRRWLLIAREMGVPDAENSPDRWALDHLFIDQDGTPTFVEVKRSTDTRVRREVVAQMLDYAANGVEYWNVAEIKVTFEQNYIRKGQDPVEVVREALGPDVEYDLLWKQVEDNLRKGKLRLLFVADEIPKELKRIVEFLNEKMEDVEVLAVEVKQFTGENLQTLVPRVIGQTSQAEIRKNVPSAKTWDAESFLDKIESDIGKPERKNVENLMKWFDENQIQFRFGKGEKHANCMMYVMSGDGMEISPFSINSDSLIYIRFDRLKNFRPFDNPERRRNLIREIQEKIGPVRYVDKIDFWPTFKISLLNPEDKLNEFKTIVLKVIAELQAGMP